jgi:hypothetical protein
MSKSGLGQKTVETRACLNRYMKTPLVLLYDRKDEFKRRYGKNLWWNASDRVWTWVGQKEVPEELKQFVARSYYTPRATGPRLEIELIPKTCWFSNIRNHVSPEGWKFISRQVFAGAGNRCQICGGRGDKWPVECHEVWEFNWQANVQALVGWWLCARLATMRSILGWHRCGTRNKRLGNSFRRLTGGQERSWIIT